MRGERVTTSPSIGIATDLEKLTWFIKKSKQFNQNDMVNNIATLTLTLCVNRPFGVLCNAVWLNETHTPTSVQFLSFSCNFPQKMAKWKVDAATSGVDTPPVWDMLALPLGPVSCEISLTQIYLAAPLTTDRVRLLLMSHYSNIAIFKGIFIDFAKIIRSKDNQQPRLKCRKVLFFYFGCFTEM